MNLPRPVRLGVAAATLLVVSACSGSVSIGDTGIDSDALADEVSAQLAETVGFPPDEVDCPDGLDAEVGAETRCTLTSDGTAYGVTVTATAVEDGDVAFDIVVDEQPLS